MGGCILVYYNASTKQTYEGACCCRYSIYSEITSASTTQLLLAKSAATAAGQAVVNYTELTSCGAELGSTRAC